MSRCRNLFFSALTALGVAAAVFGAPANASAGFEISFSSTLGSSVTFNPQNPGPGLTGSFSFTPSGNTFQITNGGTGPVTGGPNSLNALFGTITGVYNIGAITPDGTGEKAIVSIAAGTESSHLFKIDDGAGHTLTAWVNWMEIKTDGSTGSLNAAAALNLTNFFYDGTNNDLKSLATNVGGTVTATFQFATTHTLTELTTPGQGSSFYRSGSFSGSLTAPDGGPLPTPAPAGLVLMASGLPFLLVGRVLRRRANREEGTLAA